jgi:hypothetical protein
MVCATCNTSESPKFYNHPDGGKRCKRCYLKDYAAKNREKRLEKQKALYLEKKDEILARNRAYQESHREEIAENRSERYRNRRQIELIKNSQWRRANQPVKRHLNAKYRASKRRATPPWLAGPLLERILEIYKACPTGLVVDHIVPLNGDTVCGLHVPWNLQYLTPEENSRKNNKF